VVVAVFADLGVPLPTAMLQVDASAFALGAESNLDLRRHLPTRRSPRERNNRRRFVSGHATDLILAAVGTAFEEPPTDSPVEEQLAALGESPWPPFADIVAEQLERSFRSTP